MTNLAAVEQRYVAHQPISSALPKRCIGVRASILDLRPLSPASALRSIGESIQPGAIALTRTPCGETSVANVRTNPRCADFAAEYADTNGTPNSDAIDAMNNTLPRRRLIMSGNTARVRLKAAVT